MRKIKLPEVVADETLKSNLQLSSVHLSEPARRVFETLYSEFFQELENRAKPITKSEAINLAGKWYVKTYGSGQVPPEVWSIFYKKRSVTADDILELFLEKHPHIEVFKRGRNAGLSQRQIKQRIFGYFIDLMLERHGAELLAELENRLPKRKQAA